jgi:hypothetical protein
MTSTAHDLGPAGRDTTFGAGRLDAAAAVQAASRMPRAATADAVAPTMTKIEVLSPRKSTTTTFKVTWKVTKRTPWKRVGTTDYAGSYQWTKTSTKGSTRTTNTFQMRAGVVYRRTVVQARMKTPKRVVRTFLRVRVTAADDIGVDRVALEWGGRTHAVDWTAADGWLLEAPCTTSARGVSVRAYDAADNVTVGAGPASIRC